MMACMLFVRMGFAASATDAIDRYNRERVRDRRGLTVVSQKKWVHYYAALRAQSPGPGLSIAEPSFTVQKLTLHNTLTGVKPPKLRLRVFLLHPNGSPKMLLHQEMGFDEFELDHEIRGCIMFEFYRARVNGCMRAKHFKVWFNTYFLTPGTQFFLSSSSVAKLESCEVVTALVDSADKATGRVVFARSDMDWTARDKKYRRLPAAFELEMIVAGSNQV
ncbi:hypothetical protein BBJ28_00022304 [Nothophytophthora sp. Chile5]|nr:hypothetical protein BBJ28_00022304 [Nothophytophthora sp. Chile5]